MATNQSHDASLVSPAHQGGVIGGTGYKFQDAFIVRRIPQWLADPLFVALLKEGLEDVEVQFNLDGRHTLEAYQVKNHHVPQGECCKIIAGFYQKDQDSPGTYSRFILACRGLGGQVKSLRQGLERLAGAQPLYQSTDRVLQDTERDLENRAKDIGLTTGLAFLKNKLSFDTELGDMTTDVSLCREFVGGIHQFFPEWASASWVALTAAYHDLARLISASIGTICSREDLTKRIQHAIDTTSPRLDKEGVLVRLYHWEDRSFDLSQEWDVLLDWSRHFDRLTRRVPSPNLWRDQLLPELEEAQRHIRASTNSRRIRFRPSASLSAGFALGWAFNEVKGYSFEVQQGSDLWVTDNPAAAGRQWIISKELELDRSSKHLCVELNQQTNVAPKVDRFLESRQLSFRARLSLAPDSGLGNRIDGATALAYAYHAKQVVRQAIDRYECTVVHLFYAGPLGLAIFLGRLFNAMHADIQCYEEQTGDQTYTPSCSLQT